MSPVVALIGLIAALPLAQGVAFGGPAPTGPDRAVVGHAPEPTKGPSAFELRRRQSDIGPETCGWVDGIWGKRLPADIQCGHQY